MYLLACSIKNEGPDILEWVAYHRAVGFDHIAIASNDCDDGCDQLIDALQVCGFVTHHPNAFGPHSMPQHAAWRRIKKQAFFANADYLMMLDADEFLNVHIDDGTVQALARALGKHDIFTLNWAGFGPVTEKPALTSWVTERFQLCVATNSQPNKGCKSLIRAPQRFENFHNHGPTDRKDGLATTVLRDSGAVLSISDPDELVTKCRSVPMSQISHKIGQINHYGTKTMPEYRLRIERGRGTQRPAADKAERHTIDYFNAFAVTAQTDRSIERHLPKAREIADQLLEMDGVEDAFDTCMALTQAKLERAKRPWDEDTFRI